MAAPSTRDFDFPGHEEGTYYNEVHRSNRSALPSREFNIAKSLDPVDVNRNGLTRYTDPAGQIV